MSLGGCYGIDKWLLWCSLYLLGCCCGWLIWHWSSCLCTLEGYR